MPHEMSRVAPRPPAGRLARLNVATALAFVLGGSLFALGAALAGTGAAGLRTVNVVYLVGGVFFSLGGYVSIRLVRCAEDDGTLRPAASAAVERPRSPGLTSAVVLFVGTLLFAVSLVAAFAAGAHPAAVQRLDLAARHPRLRLLPRLRPPRPASTSARGASPPRASPRLVGRGGQPGRFDPVLPRRARCVHPAPRPPSSSTSACQLGHLRRRRLLRGCGGVIQAFDTPHPGTSTTPDPTRPTPPH